MPRVVVVIPAYNEAAVIRGVVESVRAMGYEVLVVNDGSTDGTTAEARAGGADVALLYKNQGVGCALSEGVWFVRTYWKTDIIVTFDADGQHSPSDIPALVAAVASGADLANGSRFLGHVEGMPGLRRVVLFAVYVVLWLVSGVEITDPCCGLKAFRPMAFQIRSHRFAWAAELCYRVSRWGRIVEIPVTVRYTDYSRAKGQRNRNIFRAGLELARAIKGDSR